jgi:hypothetical protein
MAQADTDVQIQFATANVAQDLFEFRKHAATLQGLGGNRLVRIAPDDRLLDADLLGLKTVRRHESRAGAIAYQPRQRRRAGRRTAMRRADNNAGHFTLWRPELKTP